MQPCMVWNLLCRLSWPGNHKDFFASASGVLVIKGMHYHTWTFSFIFNHFPLLYFTSSLRILYNVFWSHCSTWPPTSPRPILPIPSNCVLFFVGPSSPIYTVCVLLDVWLSLWKSNSPFHSNYQCNSSLLWWDFEPSPYWNFVWFELLQFLCMLS